MAAPASVEQSDTLCSCGRPEEHIVARSYTLDGVRVELWSTGDITGRLGAYPPGMGQSRGPRALEVGRVAWTDISLYEWRELAALLKRARRRVMQERAA